jgi:hypothetical protein
MVLIDSCLSIYIMGLYLLPEGVHGTFDKDLSRFFWQDMNGRQKYHMVKLADICAPKEHRGIGILASHHFNKALMLKWVWRIIRGGGGLWLRLINAKYLRGCPLLACDRREGSQFWRAIHDLKQEIRLGISFSIGNGEGTLFWLDPWMGEQPLQVTYPSLFAICADPMLLVASAVHEGTWNVAFRRTFGMQEAATWVELRVRARLPSPCLLIWIVLLGD